LLACCSAIWESLGHAALAFLHSPSHTSKVEVTNVSMHCFWLLVDLSVESIRKPERFPLVPLVSRSAA